MPLYYKSGGAWQNTRDIYIQRSGAWRQCAEVYVKVDTFGDHFSTSLALQHTHLAMVVLLFQLALQDLQLV